MFTPSKRHWSYYQFIDFKNPEDWRDLDRNKYAALLMNPRDNQDNIDEDYIDEVLAELPERERKRFMDGEFGDVDSGLIYYGFSRDRNVCDKAVYDPRLPIWVGMDFNVNPMTAVVSQVHGNEERVIDEIWLEGSNTHEMAEELIRRYGRKPHNIIPDSTGKRKVSSSAGLSDHQILRDYGLNVLKTSNPFRVANRSCTTGPIDAAIRALALHCTMS